MGGSGVSMWHGGVGVFGRMQKMELSVSFSRTIWHGVGNATGHSSWHCQHSVRDQGAGHRGLPVVSSHCW